MVAGKRGRPNGPVAAADEAADEAGPGPGSASGIMALHRSRMFDWKPSAVVAIAPCPGAPLFAVGYENGSFELWDINQLVCTQTVVGPSLELTSLAWGKDTASKSWRTFAAFIDGTVAEVLWRQACVAHSVESYGGVVWSLVASPHESVKPGFSHVLAAACDDGSVRLLGCEGGEPGLVHERVLARLEGRLLAAAWHGGGAGLAVAGSSGNIHLLDAVTGRETLRITTSTATLRPVTVWRLLSLPDGTLVSGDSDGCVALWDPRFGTLVQRFSRHKADVLALAATEDGSSVFAAGVDSQVAQFVRVPGSGAGRPASWAYTHYKRPHTHDVRALALLRLGAERGSVLLSGGVDAQLIAYPAEAFLKEHPTRLCKCPQRPTCRATAPAAAAAAPASTSGPAPLPPRLLVAQNESVDVWQLAESLPPVSSRGQQQHQHHQHHDNPGSSTGPDEGQPLELLRGPRHLARIRVKGARVAGAAISPSGAFVAATTPAGTRAYQLVAQGAPSAGEAAAPLSPALAAALPVGVKRLRLDPACEEAAVAVAATHSHMVLALGDGSLLACSLPEGTVTARAPPRVSGPAAQAHWAADEQAWRNHTPAVAQLLASDNGAVLAAVGCHGISLHRLPSLEPQGRLLKAADGALTAAALSRDGRLLAATTSSCALLVWDTVECRQVQWALDNADAAQAAISRLPGTPTALSFAPCAGVAADQPLPAELPYRLVVNGPGGLVHLDLSQPVEPAKAPGKRRRHPRTPGQDPLDGDVGRPESGRGSNGRVIRTVHPGVWLGHVGASELLLLEKPWEEVLEGLPPPLYTHRYGH